MGILDDAIKEHLELKRQHGAGESELQQLEDEAFGAAERPGAEESQPDAAAEAPTEFMEQPAPEPDEGPSGRREAPDIADLQEPPAMEHEAVPEATPEPEPEEPEPEPEEPEAEEPAAPEAPEAPAGPSTEERQAIAEQPTEMYDVEEELAAAQPPTPAEDEGTSLEDDEFWDEKRLSDELDEALEGPAEPTADKAEPEPAAPDEPEAAAPDEDVLEETPEFLEEAPEDDRLWFEQKPPKDFDFDD